MVPRGVEAFPEENRHGNIGDDHVGPELPGSVDQLRCHCGFRRFVSPYRNHRLERNPPVGR